MVSVIIVIVFGIVLVGIRQVIIKIITYDMSDEEKERYYEALQDPLNPSNSSSIL